MLILRTAQVPVEFLLVGEPIKTTDLLLAHLNLLFSVAAPENIPPLPKLRASVNMARQDLTDVDAFGESGLAAIVKTFLNVV